MDRLIAETDTKEEIKGNVVTQEVVMPKVKIKLKEVQPQYVDQEPIKKAEETPTQVNPYVESFGELTVADIKKQAEEESAEKFKLEKEKLIEKQFEIVDTAQEVEQKVSQNIIEKPNYDLIEENKKIVKLKKSEHKKKSSSKKVAGVMLACTLGASALVCVANTVVIDNMSSNFVEIDETYQINLTKYLKQIYNLDTTKKSMEMIETYPEDLLDAGDLGQQSNWFDRLCNFIAGMFGG